MKAPPGNVDNFSMSDDDSDKVFSIYSAHGGKLDKVKFRSVLQKFFDHTFDAYISGMGPIDRDQAMSNFEKYLSRYHGFTRPEQEATRVFYAVDSFASYT